MSDEFIHVPDIVLDDALGSPSVGILESLPEALAAWGAVMEDAIRPRIPDRSGALQADLATEVLVDDDGRGGRAVTGFGGREASIARFVELGHREIGHEPLKEVEGAVEAHPFLRPAADTAEPSALRAFEQRMGQSK